MFSFIHEITECQMRHFVLIFFQFRTNFCNSIFCTWVQECIVIARFLVSDTRTWTLRLRISQWIESYLIKRVCRIYQQFHVIWCVIMKGVSISFQLAQSNSCQNIFSKHFPRTYLKRVLNLETRKSSDKKRSMNPNEIVKPSRSYVTNNEMQREVSGLCKNKQVDK